VTLYVTCQDPNTDTLTVYTQPWLNSTPDESETPAQVSNATNASVYVYGSGNFSKHDNITFEFWCSDGATNTSKYNSTQITVLNTPPGQVTLSNPPNDNHTTDRTPEFSWNIATDADGDILQYVLNTTCYKDAGVCSPNDNGYVENISPASYVPTSNLKNFWDTQEYYNWTVKAWDGEVYGATSNERRLYIDTVVVITSINNISNFGSMNLGESNNTADNSPSPISMYNDGNCYLNISINATPIWNSSAFPSAYYQFKIDYLESNSFNWAKSITSWTNMPNTGAVAISELNYSDSSDSYESDILLTVPGDESSGTKSSVITFTGEFIDVAE